MDILPQNFRTLWLCGLWNENYKLTPIVFIYKSIVLLMIIHISSGQVFYVFATSKNVKELSSGLVFTVTFVTLCVKLCNFIFKLNDMKQLLNLFRENIYSTLVIEERIIFDNYRNRNDRFFLSILIVSQSISLTQLILPIVKWREKIELPFKIYDLFFVRNSTQLMILYVIQVIECSYSVLLNVCFDTMACGFINLTSCLFDILSLRLRNTSRNKNLSSGSMKNCYKLHIDALKILESINSFFMGSIAIVFVLILLVICSGIFLLTEKSSLLSADKLILPYFIGYIIVQAYVYCWFGTELEEKVKNLAVAAYETNWCCASVTEVKNLSFMILIAQRGSNVSFKGLCTLSHETFGLVKKIQIDYNPKCRINNFCT
ncbi:odorant receptor 94b-like [Leptopilina heterotoma]|uniref:odorant receptor 94b-like n=1 Tax=Leptopilina heterotoma TaxID=63436 RepID=UPI001CA91173|nr:odorant receptor 94b-like [Leptopilina heterotoma]